LPADKTEKRLILEESAATPVREGNESRVLDELPMKMAIFDEKIVMVSLEDPIQGTISLTILVMEHHAMAKGLKAMFETYWVKATDHYILDGHEYHWVQQLKGKDKRRRKSQG
jgi:hypothetical protein